MHDLFVRGEWIAQINTSDSYDKAWNKFYSENRNLASLDLRHLFRLMHETEWDIKVLLMHSKQHAEMICDKVSHEVKK